MDEPPVTVRNRVIGSVFYVHVVVIGGMSGCEMPASQRCLCLVVYTVIIHYVFE